MPRVPDPAPLPPRLEAGAFTIADADRLGLPRGRLFRSDLHRPHRGVRVRTPPRTIEERCAAYGPLLGTTRFFSHGTAALLHGLPVPRGVEDDPDLHVSVFAPAQPPRALHVVGHQLRPRPGVRGVAQGLPATTPEETWAQLAGDLAIEALVVIGDHLVRHGIADPEAVLGRLRSARSATRRRGGERLQLAYYLIRPGTRSPMESLLRFAIVNAGLPEPAVNLSVFDEAGRFLGEGDLVYPEARLVLEYEGDHHRTDPAQFRSDIRRRERFHDAGWDVLRITADDLFRHRAELIERVRRRLTARLPA